MMTLDERCALATACLPQSEYRNLLEALHAELLALRHGAELLNLTGEGVLIGDISAEELAPMAKKPALSVSLADGRVVVLVGMTRDECLQCLPAFMAPARLTVSAA